MATRAEVKTALARPARADDGAHWSDLMARGRAGDRRAYDRLLAETRAWLAGYFRRRLPPAQAEDAVQETLIALHHRRHDFDCAQPLRPWLATIARFKWIDRLRRMDREAAAPELDTSVSSHESDIVAGRAISGLLSQLRPAQAEAIRLVKLDGLSILEAAQRSGQSQSLVKINIHRGMKQLMAACR